MADDLRITEYYTVNFRPFDRAEDAGSVLGAARRDFFGGRRSVKNSFAFPEDGREVKIRCRLSDGCFRWKKTCGSAILEETFQVREGYRMLSHSPEGGLRRAVLYDRAQHWVRSSYFSGDPLHPSAVLERDGGGLVLRTAEGDAHLTPFPWNPGTAEQSLVNAKAGEPSVTAETDAGRFCFCTEEELELRAAAREELKNGAVSAWSGAAEQEDLSFRPVPNGEGTEASAPAEKPEKQPETADSSAAAPQTAETEREKGSAGEPQDYAADREIFTTEEHPAKYAVAAKGLSGAVRGGLRSAKELPPECAPAKRIVVSSAESYLYFGRLIDGLRQGQGRTQMAGGHTAYEGGYRDDQRDGFGVYYYKSGKLCYAGGWKKNLRDGLGVAFARDGSVFVGNWSEGAANGVGTEFDLAGNPVRTGVWRGGKYISPGEKDDSGR